MSSANFRKRTLVIVLVALGWLWIDGESTAWAGKKGGHKHKGGDPEAKAGDETYPDRSWTVLIACAEKVKVSKEVPVPTGRTLTNVVPGQRPPGVITVAPEMTTKTVKQEQLKQWTERVQWQGKFVRVDGIEVVLHFTGAGFPNKKHPHAAVCEKGKDYRFKLSQLSEVDRQYIRSIVTDAAAKKAAETAVEKVAKKAAEKAAEEPAEEAKAEKETKEEDTALRTPPSLISDPKWSVIFRSAYPIDWNTDSKNDARFAVPLSSVPGDIRYLRMAIDAERFVIIAMTKQILGGVVAQDRYGWKGTAKLSWGGRQLGIFDKTLHGNVALDWDKGPLSGWGFGFRQRGQAYAWEGKAIEQTVFEISVTSSDLSPLECQHLLGEKPAEVVAGRTTVTLSDESKSKQPPAESAAPQTQAPVSHEPNVATRGNVKVQVLRVKVDKVALAPVMGGTSVSEEPLCQISLRIINNDSARKIDYRGWQGNSLMSDATLTDNIGNRYKGIDFGFANSVVGRLKSESIYPRKSVEDLLVFEVPVDVATSLNLELPAGNIGETEDILITLPKEMWSVTTSKPKELGSQ